MSVAAFTHVFLENEARAMRTRLDRLTPLSVSMTMVPAANIPIGALAQVERLLDDGRVAIKRSLAVFSGWLESPRGRSASIAEAQRRFTLVRLRFHAFIARFDIFSDVLVQRSERENGVWIAGLDDLAADALRLPGLAVRTPPLICYLDRGVGAAIRRARTRLPGGPPSPVAVIRVPRERMVGQAIGASLVHEVGHQAASLFELLPGIRSLMQARQRTESRPLSAASWSCWERWCSEAIADVWAVAQLGVSATLGLIGVVSLPRAFVFRVDLEDPHPFPWIRVLLSAAVGMALYPDAIWGWIERMWKSMYPIQAAPPALAPFLSAIERTLPEAARLLLAPRTPQLGHRSLGECLARLERSPQRLAVEWDRLQREPARAARLSPTLALATVSQARIDRRLSPERESELIARMLGDWAMRSSLSATARCGGSVARLSS
jgi:hypothetical protein